MNAHKLSYLLLTCVLVISMQVFALTPAKEGTPFQIIGYIQKFKLDHSLCPRNPVELQGALMTVNGIEVIIPCNTIISMPATYLTPYDIFQLSPTGNPGESGLSLETNQPPAKGVELLAPFEATLSGNIVGGRYIAGLVSISQQSLNNGAGYITHIDMNDGFIYVGGTLNTPNGARIRINDSEGRFGIQTSFLNQGTKPNDVPNKIKITEDGRFTADIDNSTIHATTGFPMCLPRKPADDECPMGNRPKENGKPLSFFVMGPDPIKSPVPGSPEISPCSGCNPEKQAPLVVGDYINYAGTLAKDTAGYYISAHTIDAWVGIYTKPNSDVAYIMQEVSLIGTGTGTIDVIQNPETPGASIAQEVAPRLIKVVGFTTDPSRSVEVYALEVDSRGVENPILIGKVPPEAVPYGRFRFIIDRAGVGKKQTSPALPPVFVVTKPVKEIRVVVPGGVKSNIANGLTSGQYDAPVSEYIFAENTVFGEPLVPFNFHRFCFLAKGTGPLKTAGRSGTPGVSTTTLVPWPGTAGTSFDPSGSNQVCQ